MYCAHNVLCAHSLSHTESWPLCTFVGSTKLSIVLMWNSDYMCAERKFYRWIPVEVAAFGIKEAVLLTWVIVCLIFPTLMLMSSSCQFYQHLEQYKLFYQVRYLWRRNLPLCCHKTCLAVFLEIVLSYGTSFVVVEKYSYSLQFKRVMCWTSLSGI